jgi:hypothetical protein
MGNDIRFLGNDLDDQVLDNKSPKGMTKRIGTVRGIPVVPNGAMCPQNDHAVYKASEQEWPAEILGQEDEKGNRKQTRTGPPKQRQPILAGCENILASKKLSEQLPIGRDKELSVGCIAISWWL